MAFELGKTANGAKYVIGQNGNEVYLSQAGIQIKEERFGDQQKFVVNVLNMGQVIFSGLLEELLYQGSPISSDPAEAIDFLVGEGWVNFSSGSGGGTIDPQDYDLADFSNLSADPFVQESDLLNKADLVGGKVPISQLPSYVDDVLEFSSLANFPIPGESGKIYTALDSNRLYRWTGSSYIEVSSASITTSGNTGQVSFFTSPTNIGSDGSILWDNTNKRLAVGVTSPTESIDVNTLRARGLPDGNSDITFTRNVIMRNNGTFGWETKPTPNFYPKVSINSYTQDATDYILKVTVSNLPPEGYSSTGGLFNVSVFGSNPVNAANITATNDATLGYANNIISLSPYIALGSLDFTIKFPKASNTSPIWNNQNALIAVAWRGTDNADGGTSSPYKPRRLANDGKLIGELQMGGIMASITSSLTTTTLVTSTPTAVPFNVDDNLAFGTITHSTTTNNSRFSVTRNGKYVFFAQPQIERISTATAACVFWLRKNGTTVIPNSAIRYQPGSNMNIPIPLSVTVDLLTNEYIEVMCQTNDNNTYQMTNTAGSGTGASQIPNTPACIIDVKGFFN